MISKIHHIQFYVLNGLQASFWFCFNLGFKRFAAKRTNDYLETAIRNKNIILTFKCSISPNFQQVGLECAKHGDFVKSISFLVDDLDSLIDALTEAGCEVIESTSVISDSYGTVKIARIKGSAGSIEHTLVQNIDYDGAFLPGFQLVSDFNMDMNLPPITFEFIDHVVEAHDTGTLDNVIEWYQRSLKMHRFWSIDDQEVQTEYNALRAVFVGNNDKSVKMTLVEPVIKANMGVGLRGQVQEFIDHHGSQGIQHIAFFTSDICKVVSLMRKRSVEFLDIPDTYYDILEKRLENSSLNISEDLKQIRRLKILVDFDENGYLLQIFTKPVQDRPTLFLEVIQRHNYDGFGAKNFKALFEAVELEQKRRNDNVL